MKLNWKNAITIPEFPFICFYPLNLKSSKDPNMNFETKKKIQEKVWKNTSSLNQEQNEQLNAYVWGNSKNREEPFVFPIPFSKKGTSDGVVHHKSFTEKYTHIIYKTDANYSILIDQFFSECIKKSIVDQYNRKEYFHSLVDQAEFFRPTYKKILEVTKEVEAKLAIPTLSTLLNNHSLFDDYYYFIGKKNELNKMFFKKKCQHHNTESRTTTKNTYHLICHDCSINGYILPDFTSLKLDDGISTNLNKILERYLSFSEKLDSLDLRSLTEKIMELHDINSFVCENKGKIDAIVRKRYELKKNKFFPNEKLPSLPLFHYLHNVSSYNIAAKRKDESFLQWGYSLGSSLDSLLNGINKVELDEVPDKLHSFYEELLEFEENLNQLPKTFTFSTVSFDRQLFKDFLSFVKNMDGKYGLTTYAEMFSGSTSSKMKNYDLLKKKEHAMLSNHSYEDIRSCMEEIIVSGYCKKVGSDYPKYEISSKGSNFLYYLEQELTESTKKNFQEFLSLNFSSFEKESKAPYVPEKWVISYLKNALENNGLKGFKEVIGFFKKRKNKKYIDDIKPFLLEHCHESYLPVLVFIKKAKSGKEYYLDLIDYLLTNSKGVGV